VFTGQHTPLDRFWNDNDNDNFELNFPLVYYYSDDVQGGRGSGGQGWKNREKSLFNGP
jgi:hypothetical protein